MRETVLYYMPEGTTHMARIKGVLVQMGIRIKNLTPGRCEKKIGLLAGLDGFEEDPTEVSDESSTINSGSERKAVEGQQASVTDIQEELMVLCGFTDRRLDELLQRLRKAGVPRTVLKAVVTESNAQWTVYELYGHLVEERRQMEQG